jgi:hypothetical protein
MNKTSSSKAPIPLKDGVYKVLQKIGRLQPDDPGVGWVIVASHGQLQSWYLSAEYTRPGPGQRDVTTTYQLLGVNERLPLEFAAEPMQIQAVEISGTAISRRSRSVRGADYKMAQIEPGIYQVSQEGQPVGTVTVVADQLTADEAVPQVFNESWQLTRTHEPNVAVNFSYVSEAGEGTNDSAAVVYRCTTITGGGGGITSPRR